MSRPQPIAIVGVGAILPGGLDAATAWGGWRDGRSAIEPVPRELWDLDVFLDPTRANKDLPYSRVAAPVRGFRFDAASFRMPPAAARQMDPIHEVSLVCARQALADAGFDGPTGGVNGAVILGNLQGGAQRRGERWFRLMHPLLEQTIENLPAFQQLSARAQSGFLDELSRSWRDQFPEMSGESLCGVLGNLAAARVAHYFDLHGPSSVIDAACASSLAALEASVAGLQAGRFDLAVTGGVDMLMDVPSYAAFCAMGALSPDGSYPFDARANGFVMGEGAAMFVLKRLDDARKAGDRVYAVVHGIGSSSDGRGRSIVAPNPDGQIRAMRAAWTAAGRDPSTVGYIEAHGTATPLGDPTEVHAMREVFTDASNQSLPMGSVKANVGHLKAAAGAAGLLRAVMALHHRTIPPHANFETPNPNCEFETSPFRIPTTAEAWEGDDRVAAVSAFGFGGVDYHVILGEADAATTDKTQVQVAHVPTSLPLGLGVIALGAPDRAALAAKARQLRAGVADPMAVARRCAAGPAPAGQPVRAALFAEDEASATKQLDALIAALEGTGSEARLSALGVTLSEGPGFEADEVAFLFPGQGSQYLGMLDQLRARYPVVQATLDEADDIMRDLLEGDLSAYISPPDGKMSGQAFRALMRTEILQPAMLASDEALRRLLSDVVQPRVVLGHSLGEYAACTAAGVLNFADCLQIVAARGGAMEEVSIEDNGLMLGVNSDEATVRAELPGIEGYVDVVNKNCPSQTIVGGATRPIKELEKRLKAKGLQCMLLPVSHAFHSEIVAPASAPLRRALDRVEVNAPTVPLLSNVTGGFYPTGDDEDPSEWARAILARQVASPVEFIQNVESAWDAGCRVFVEVGPKRALSGFVRDILGDRRHQSVFLAHPKFGEMVTLGRAVASLVAEGVVAYGRPVAAAAAGAGEIQTRLPRAPRVAASPDTLAAAEEARAEAARAVVPAAGGGLGDLAHDARFWQFIALQGPAMVQSLAASYRAGQALHGGGPQPAAGATMAPLATAPVSPTAVAPPSATPSPARAPVAPAAVAVAVSEARPAEASPDPGADVAGWVLDRVADATGYDRAELDVDADLEADLGIDSIRQIEIILGIRDELNLPADEGFKVSDYPNLRALIGYVETQQGSGGPSPAAADGGRPADLKSWVLDRVADATGYSVAELDVDADLEADLGVDSIRQIEILLQVRDELGLPADEAFRPSDYPNLRALVDYLDGRLESSRPF